MYWKWIGRLAFIAVVYVAADAYASSVVRGRMTELQETLIAPDGRRVNVSRTVSQNGPRLIGGATVVSVEEVSFGYRVTYAAPSRPRLVCTYRLPGIKCDDGWTVEWSRRVGRR